MFGTAYVANVVKDASITYGVFAVVLGLLAWIFLAALGVVLSVEINVVRSKHLFPRALLTPFTDNVDLTRADQRAYTDAATAQRHKGFESVDVTFEHRGPAGLGAEAGRRRGPYERQRSRPRREHLTHPIRSRPPEISSTASWWRHELRTTANPPAGTLTTTWSAGACVRRHEAARSRRRSPPARSSPPAG